MKIKVFLIILLISKLSIAQKSDVKYDFSCYNTDPFTALNSMGNDFEEAMLNGSGAESSVADEQDLGKTAYDEAKKEYKFIESGSELENLKRIVSKLNKVIQKPKGFTYKVFLIDTNVVNAWTVGGYIYFTNEMYKFCKTNDEIACILGHEMAHNELGHIGKHIKRLKAANNMFGEGFGNLAASIGTLFTTPFNQKNEAHSDMVGMDYAIAAGYDACQNIDLWKRMKEKEGSYSFINGMLNTHPYSGTRSECAKNHLKTNYNKDCKN